MLAVVWWAAATEYRINWLLAERPFCDGNSFIIAAPSCSEPLGPLRADSHLCCSFVSFRIPRAFHPQKKAEKADPFPPRRVVERAFQGAQLHIIPGFMVTQPEP